MSENREQNTELKVTMTSEETAYDVGEIINYCVVLKNKASYLLYNIELSDCLAPQLQFVNGSVMIDNVATPLQNIVNGVEIEYIEPGETIKIYFKALVLNIPSNGKIVTQLNVSYDTPIDEDEPYVSKTIQSNKNIVSVDVVNLDIQQSANKKNTILNDNITYTIVIKNNGTVSVENVVLTEVMDYGLEYVKNSFVMNETCISGIDIIDKINLGSLKPEEEVKIVFDAIVKKPGRNSLVTNKSIATFSYRMSSEGITKNKTIESNKVSVQISIPTFKQIDVDGVLCIPYPKPEIKQINEIKVHVEILDYHVIKTIKGVSAENKTLTGSELIALCKVNYIVNYVSDDCSDSIFSSCFEKKLSAGIVLPEEIKSLASIRIIPTIVEDVYYRKISCREIYSSVNLFLSANLAH